MKKLNLKILALSHILQVNTYFEILSDFGGLTIRLSGLVFLFRLARSSFDAAALSLADEALDLIEFEAGITYLLPLSVEIVDGPFGSRILALVGEIEFMGVVWGGIWLELMLLSSKIISPWS